jgi:hypothetical protein
MLQEPRGVLEDDIVREYADIPVVENWDTPEEDGENDMLDD